MSVGPGRGVDYPGTWLRDGKLKDAAGPPKMVRSQMLSPNEQLRDPDLSQVTVFNCFSCTTLFTVHFIKLFPYATLLHAYKYHLGGPFRSACVVILNRSERSRYHNILVSIQISKKQFCLRLENKNLFTTQEMTQELTSYNAAMMKTVEEVLTWLSIIANAHGNIPKHTYC